MIQIENLSKRYGQQVVLQLEHLDIPAGERFGLVGNNGAGKTTLFSLLLDLIRADTGEVRSKGEAVAGHDSWKAYTGAYIDDSFLIGHLTPEEYFHFVGELYGMNASDVSAFLVPFAEFFNGEILDSGKYIRNMSKGNKKKVGIAAALLGRPEVLILDEPFANLDPSSQIRLKQLIRNLPDRLTVLISSHDLAHVTEVCERIVLLERGQVVRDIKDAPERALQELEAYFAQ